MKFGDIFAVLVVLLVLYYVAMIAMDVYKEKLKKISEKENDPDVDIDISDEAQSFTPIQVRRDDAKPVVQPEKQQEEKLDESLVQVKNDDSQSWKIPQSVFDGHRSRTAGSTPASTNTENPTTGISVENMDSEHRLNVRITYREPCMTNGMLVEDLVELSNRISNDGTADLQDIVMKCEAA